MRRLFLIFRLLVLPIIGQKRYLALRSAVFGAWNTVFPPPDPATLRADTHDQIEQSDLTFSIIIPIYNTPEDLLRQCLQSVYDQTYPNWELILVDDGSSEGHIRPMLEDAATNPHVKTILRAENGNISQALNTGLEAATGDYMTVLDHDDMLHPAALYWIVDALLRHPEAEYLYSDEDKINGLGQKRIGPFLKPGWSPELTLQCMYSCHMSVYEREKAQSIGGYRSAFDGAQDFDFMLRFISRFSNIQHVNKVLYHWRQWEASTAMSLDAKPEAYHRQRRALQEYLDANGEVYDITDHALHGHHKVSFLPKTLDKVSIIIPTANRGMEVNGITEHHADRVVQSILETSTYQNFEIILAHNGDLRPDQIIAFQAIDRVRLIEYDDSAGFNLSDKINLGASIATGDYFLILNDDIRLITTDWIERMLGMAQRHSVGAVGAKLLFPNNTVQHNGVWLRGHLPGHIDYGAPRDAIGYDLSGIGNRNCIAVTGACQMTPRDVFEDLGGYDPKFSLNFNDVDYCLRLYEKGHRSICLGDVELYHYEGVSKEGGASVRASEIELFLSTWRDRVPKDPYLPSNLV
ncbi:MAG: glycosyltransferase [Pseudomonadota bacterium]